mgnify:CR=1 FL=1
MNDPASKFEAWVAKAEEDRLCIRNNLAAAVVPWAVVCFHGSKRASGTTRPCNRCCPIATP